LSVQIGATLGERMIAAATGKRTEAPISARPDSPITDAEIEAAANAVERQVLGNFDLGFQAMLRLNFPRDRLRQMAHAALIAASDAVGPR
jgi:hypothetical protein